jgi:hypothetical protein
MIRKMIKKMNRTAPLCLAVLLAVTGMTGASALALADGSYLVANNTYYVNPDTGNADDGGDTSTGEAMCRNTVYPQSVYELKGGRHYVTLRIKMRSFIKNIKFEVQQTKGDGNSYRQVDYEVVGANKEENTEDFRFEVPAPDALVRPGFFVGPMNRDVVFFMALDMSTARQDSGSFAAFNGGVAPGSSSSQPAEPVMEQLQPYQPEAPAGSSGNSVPGSDSPGANGAPQAGDGQEVRGIVEFDAQGEAAATAADQGSAPVPPAVLIALAVVVCLAAGGYLFYRNRKKHNLNRV